MWKRGSPLCRSQDSTQCFVVDPLACSILVVLDNVALRPGLRRGVFGVRDAMADSSPHMSRNRRLASNCLPLKPYLWSPFFFWFPPFSFLFLCDYPGGSFPHPSLLKFRKGSPGATIAATRRIWNRNNGTMSGKRMRCPRKPASSKKCDDLLLLLCLGLAFAANKWQSRHHAFPP